MMDSFTITYPQGKMTLNLEAFFETSPKGRLINTTVTKMEKVFTLIRDNCQQEDIDLLLSWLDDNHKAYADRFRAKAGGRR